MRFVQRVLALRREESALRHARWFEPAPAPEGERSIVWLAPSGREMQVDDWHDGAQHAFACRIDASPKSPHDNGGSRHLLIAFNPEPQPCAFTLPPGRWQIALDSSDASALGAERLLEVAPHSLTVLRDSDNGP
jgi:glycogen operon protein